MIALVLLSAYILVGFIFVFVVSVLDGQLDHEEILWVMLAWWIFLPYWISKVGDCIYRKRRQKNRL